MPHELDIIFCEDAAAWEAGLAEVETAEADGRWDRALRPQS